MRKEKTSYNIPLKFELTGKQKNAQIAFCKNHLVFDGSSGTGKTFIALYLALQALKNKQFERIIIVRSPTQTIDVGYLPGGIDLSGDGGKLLPFIAPYQKIVNDIMGKNYWDTAFCKTILFEAGIAIRGLTFDNAIVIVDEMQNYNFHALDSIITRLGSNTKLIMCGDYYQSDLVKKSDKNGILKFLSILESVPYFHFTHFTRDDIVRSDLVKQYIIAREDYERDNPN
jgi:phosphate starvation-inducible PhoH-like protein